MRQQTSLSHPGCEIDENERTPRAKGGTKAGGRPWAGVANLALSLLVTLSLVQSSYTPYVQAYAEEGRAVAIAAQEPTPSTGTDSWDEQANASEVTSELASEAAPGPVVVDEAMQEPAANSMPVIETATEPIYELEVTPEPSEGESVPTDSVEIDPTDAQEFEAAPDADQADADATGDLAGVLDQGVASEAAGDGEPLVFDAQKTGESAAGDVEVGQAAPANAGEGALAPAGSLEPSEQPTRGLVIYADDTTATYGQMVTIASSRDASGTPEAIDGASLQWQSAASADGPWEDLDGAVTDSIVVSYTEATWDHPWYRLTAVTPDGAALVSNAVSIEGERPETFVLDTCGVLAQGAFGVDIDLVGGASVWPAFDPLTHERVVVAVSQVRCSSDTTLDWSGDWRGANILNAASADQFGNVRSRAWYVVDYEARTESGQQVPTSGETWHEVCLTADGVIGGLATPDSALVVEGRLDGVDEQVVASGRTVNADVSIRTLSRDRADCAVYEDARVWFELSLPGKPGEAWFDTDAMAWLKDRDATWRTMDVVDRHGNPCSVLVGTMVWDGTPDEPAVAGSAPDGGGRWLSLNIAWAARANADRQVAPIATFWLDGNRCALAPVSLAEMNPADYRLTRDLDAAERDDRCARHDALEALVWQLPGVTFTPVEDRDGMAGAVDMAAAASSEQDGAQSSGALEEADTSLGDAGGTSFADAIELSVGETKTVVTTTGGQYVYFKVTMPITHQAVWRSFVNGDKRDTVGTVYNSSQSSIASDDDNGGNNQFRVSYAAQAGQTYYFVARIYGSSNVGQFDVRLDYDVAGPHAFVDGVCACGEAEQTIADGETKQAVISEAGDGAAFTFTPEFTHVYEIRFTGDNRSKRYIVRNQSGTQVAGGSSSSPNFTVTLQEGTTYTIFGNYYDPADTGTFNVSLAHSPSRHTFVDGVCACGEPVGEITLDETESVEIPQGESVFYKFVCDDTHGYALGTSLGVSHSLTVWNEDMTSTVGSYTGSSSINVTPRLLAGTTYYIEMKNTGTSGDASGSLTVSYDRAGSYHTFADGVCVCGKQAGEIALDETETAVMGPGTHVFYKFIPEHTHSYAFATSSDATQSVTIWNEALSSSLTSSSSSATSTAKVQLTAGTVYYVDVRNTNSSRDSSMSLTVSYDQDGTYHEFEDGECFCGKQAEEIGVGDTKSVQIGSAGQRVWYAFTPEHRHTYVIATEGDTGYNKSVYLYDSSGSVVTSSQNVRTPSISTTLAPGQTYYICTYYNTSSHTGSYNLSLGADTNGTVHTFDGNGVCSVCGIEPELLEVTPDVTHVTMGTGEKVYYRISPAHTHTYKITTTNNPSSIYLYVYNPDMSTSSLAYHWGGNYSANVVLNGGRDYYLLMYHTSSSATDSEYDIALEYQTVGSVVHACDETGACPCGIQAIVLEPGDSETASVEAGQSAYYTITPEATHTYTVRLSGDSGNKYLNIVDENGTQVYNNYSSSTVTATVKLEEGKTYTVRCYYSSSSQAGDLTASLDYTPEGPVHAFVDGECPCGAHTVDLGVGQTKTQTITAYSTDPAGRAHFKITPEITHQYRMLASTLNGGGSSMSCYAYLYNDAGGIVTSTSGGQIVTRLEAGRTYDLVVYPQSATATGNYTASLYYDDHTHTFMDGRCACGEAILPLTLDAEETATLSEPFAACYYEFNPDFTHGYRFESEWGSTTSYNRTVTVYDENWTRLGSAAGSTAAASAAASLEEGKTYYVKVNYESQQAIGTAGIIPLVDNSTHVYDEDGVCACGDVLTTQVIHVDETKRAVIAEANTRIDYVFECEEDGSYTFSSKASGTSYDTLGQIYDEDWNLIASDDNSGGTSQFSVTYPLEAGKTYYMSAKINNANQLGIFNVNLAKKEIPEVTCGSSVATGVDFAGTNLVKFVPEYDHHFEIGGSDLASSTTLYVYDEDMRLVASGSVGTGGSLGVDLEGGKTYYIQPKYASSSAAAGTGTIGVELGAHRFDDEGRCVCGEELSSLTITDGETIDFAVDPAGTQTLIKVDPQLDHRYTFRGTQTNGSMNMVLYDEDMHVLASQSSTAPSVSYDLEAGKTYYLGMAYASAAQTGTPKASMSLAAHAYTDGECTCGDHEYDELVLDEAGAVDITVDSERERFTFTPEFDHDYLFAVDSSDTSTKYIRVLDENGTQLVSASGANPLANRALEAGKTYVIETYYSSSTARGAYTVTPTLNNHHYVDGLCACGEEMPELTVDENQTATIQGTNEQWFVIHPEHDHDYLVEVTYPSTTGTKYIYLYDADMNLYASQTSAYSNVTTSTHNWLTYYLDAGETYYVRLTGSSNVPLGKATVNLDLCNHDFEDVACTECDYEMPELENGASVSSSLKCGLTEWAVITPDVTHEYVLSMSGAASSKYLYLYDENMALVTSTSGSSATLGITRDLEEGKTYYVAYRYSYGNTLGTETVSLDYGKHVYAGGECTCGDLLDDNDRGQCGDDLWWSYDADTGTLVIEGTGDMWDFTSGDAPWSNFVSDIKTVDVADGATSIGNYAFSGCTDLTEANLPESLVSVGDAAFNGCSSLTEAGLPSNVEWIGTSAFSGCKSLASIDLPEGLANIGSSAFSNCSSLTAADVPDSVRTLGTSVFSGCTSLASAHLPAGLKYIPSNTFYNCTSLSDFEIPDTVRRIDGYAFYNCAALGSVAFPDALNTIGSNAFDNCTHLAQVEFGDGLRSIGSYAFRNCDALPSIEVPEGVTSLGTYAFYDCDGLTSAKLPSTVTTVPSYCFYSCDRLQSVEMPNVTQIDSYAFQYCRSLTDPGMPDTLKTIGAYAYQYCSSLVDLDVPEGVTTINSQAFAHCSGLLDVTLPETLTTLGGYAFRYCNSLEEIELPEGITTINDYTFDNCPQLKKVTIPSTVNRVNSYAFTNCPALEDMVIRSRDLNNTNATSLSDRFMDATITVGKEVETLRASVLNTMVGSSLGGLRFEGPQEFTLVGDLARETLNRPLRYLPGGHYYAGEQGALYWLDDETHTAHLAYVPDGLTSYEVLANVGLDGSYPVTGVNRYSLTTSEHLEALTFANPDTITSLASYAFAYCPTLSTVNGEHYTSRVTASFPNLEDMGSMPYVETGLEDDTDEFVKSQNGRVEFDGDSMVFVIEALPGTKRPATNSDGSPLLDDEGNPVIGKDATGTLLYYTGEPVTITVSASNENNTDEYIYRVYMRFSDDGGGINYDPGEHTIRYNDVDYKVKIVQTDDPNTYYLELPDLIEGETLAVLPVLSYPSPQSQGGKADVWGIIMSEEESEANEGKIVTVPGMEYTEISWATKPDDFRITKRAGSNTVSLLGDGTADGDITVRNLQWTINYTRVGDTLEGIGKDLVLSVDFTDRMTLPEGMRWREGMLEAVRDGNVYISRSSSSFDVYAVIDGTTVQIANVSAGSSVTGQGVRLAKDENGDDTIEIFWTKMNASTITEIGANTTTLTLGTTALVVEDLSKDSYTIRNDAEETTHYTYSDDTSSESDATRTVAVGAANLSFSKYMGGGNFGTKTTTSISMSNSGTKPVTGLTEVTDTLPMYVYMSGSDIEGTFGRDKYQSLRVTLTNATLYEVVRETVVGSDGRTYVVNQQVKTEDNSYSGLSRYDHDIVATGVTIVFSWNEDKTGITMQVGDAAPVPVDDVQTALDDLGYMPTLNDRYALVWDLPEGYQLASNQSESFVADIHHKDTFMRLTGDFENHYNANSQYEVNYAYVHDAQGVVKSYSYSQTVYREFELTKGARIDGKVLDAQTVVSTGDVIDYTLNVSRGTSGGTTYPALPLTDRMQGPQVLMVTVQGNSSLSGLGLEVIEDGGRQYYLLGPGTYHNVRFGTYLADTVTVTQIPDGYDTKINWYLAQVTGSYSASVPLRAYVSTEITAPGVMRYNVGNEVWLGDHEGHRLHDDVGIEGSEIRFDKSIVTNPREVMDHTQDQLASQSTVAMGNTVLYRFYFEHIYAGTQEKQTVTLTGRDIYDELPFNTEHWKWDETKIQVFYEDPSMVTNGDHWFVSDESGGLAPGGPNTQFLRWDDDFSITFRDDAYMYVMLQFPDDGDLWREYCEAYGNNLVFNTLYVTEVPDSVLHYLQFDVSAVLQKGVVATGVYRSSSNSVSLYENTLGDSRYYYMNNDLASHYVQYYSVLYNQGPTRLYLDTWEDILPRGFELIGVVTSGRNCYTPAYATSSRYLNYSTRALGITDPEHAVTYRTALMRTETFYRGGTQHIYFDFYTDRTNNIGNLSYDEVRGMYYLAPGEALQISYVVSTGSLTASDAISTNSIAMPYVSYAGERAVLAEGVGIQTTQNPERTPNDGADYLWDNSEARVAGYRGGSADTQWLASDVTVERGSIIPGITKSVTSTTSVNGTVVNNPISAAPQDKIAWTVNCDNAGTDDIRDYALTDVMQSPYSFVGDVQYAIDYGRNYTSSVSNAYSVVGTLYTLFTITDRAVAADGTTTLTLAYGNSSPRATTTVTYGGDPVAFNAVWAGVSCPVEVSFYFDEDGNEVMRIRFKSDYMALPSMGQGRLRVTTENLANVFEQKVYYNTCYITPLAQEYDPTMVTRGNETSLAGHSSVRNSTLIAVAIGFATEAVKSVKELSRPTNQGYSNFSYYNPLVRENTNYITLQGRDSLFDYRLTVLNTTERAMTQLVLIDSLPEVGDHGVFMVDDPRLSEFLVSFADDPNFRVTVTSQTGVTTTVPADKYTIDFATKTEFESADWLGAGSGEGWVATSSGDTRSFRITFIDDTARLIPPYSSINIELTAKVDGPAAPGDIAWNSFGYHYKVNGFDQWLEAAPLKVGVKIAEVPQLQKIALDNGRRPAQVVEDEDFTFVVYRGAAISIADLTSAEAIQQALADAGVTDSFVVTLTIPAGASQSEPTTLFELPGVPEDWAWVEGQRYTFVEVDLADDAWTFVRTNSGYTNSSTITYAPQSLQRVAFTNTDSSWEIALTKVDADDADRVLAGAWMGLYASDETDAMSQAAYDELELSEGLEVKPARTVEADGSTWWLKAIAVTGEDGKLSFAKLRAERYAVVEVQSPEGYRLEDEPRIVERTAGASSTSCVFENTQHYVLPETGGNPYAAIALGALGVTMGLSAAALRRRRDSELEGADAR